jgi:hypothetical protein
VPSFSRVWRGRCLPTRNGHLHRKDAAGYGSKRLHTDYGDNVGKDQLPAGTGNNLQRPFTRAYKARRTEGFHLAHEPVRAMNEG